MSLLDGEETAAAAALVHAMARQRRGRLPAVVAGLTGGGRHLADRGRWTAVRFVEEPAR